MFSNPHLQTLIGSTFPILKKNSCENSIIFTDKLGDKVIVEYSVDNCPEFIVFMIHGWFGSISSPVIAKYSKFLRKENLGIVKINLKDHGNTEHINPSLFTFYDINYIAEIISYFLSKYNSKGILLGFSFGANILLRLLPSLNNREQIIGVLLISPVFDIKVALNYIENTIIYKKILLWNWEKSLKRKQNAFPNLYDFSQCYKCNSAFSIISHLLPYMDFCSLSNYLEGCLVSAKCISSIDISTLILVSVDDPVIPIENISYLENSIINNKKITFIKTDSGGHISFQTNLFNNFGLQLTSVFINQLIREVPKN